MEALIKSQKAYEKAHKEAEKALENYHKADADIYLSRAEVINYVLIYFACMICWDLDGRYL